MRLIHRIPNFLTFVRIALTPLFLFFIFKGGWFLVAGIITFTIAALTDTFDGYVARRYQAYSRLGAFLDPIADKILICSTLGAFVVLSLIPWWAFVIICARDVFVTSLRIKYVAQKSILKTSWLAKCKTTAQFLMMYLFFFSLVARWQAFPVGWYQATDVLATIILYGVVGLTLYSGFDYFKRK